MLAIASAFPAQARLTISTQATKNVSCANGICTATAKQAVLNVDDLTGMLVSSDVAVATGSSADDIVVAAPFGWSTASRLTLEAARSVIIDRPVAVSGVGALAVTTNDGGINGLFSFGTKGDVTFANLGSGLTIDQTNYTLEGSIATLAAAIAANPAGAFALANSYDASVDGTYTASPIPTRFTGAFEGLGNTISNLTINDNNDTNVGLFADVGSSGAVSDIRLTNASVSSATTQNSLSIGPLAGLNEGTVHGATSTGSVSGSGGNYPDAGGLVGTNIGAMAYSHSAVTVTGGDSGFAGGLVGYAQTGIVYASSATGVVSAGQGCEVGGFAGANDGQIKQSFSTGQVNAQRESKSGGFIGYDTGPVNDSYATGNATQASELGYSGGFVGFYQPSGTAILTRNYSTGAPSGGNFDGGFIGFDDSLQTNLAFNYWNMTTSGINNPSGGAGNVSNDPGIKGLTSRQLEARLPHGFKRSTWGQNKSINQGFPYLRANPPAK